LTTGASSRTARKVSNRRRVGSEEPKTTVCCVADRTAGVILDSRFAVTQLRSPSRSQRPRRPSAKTGSSSAMTTTVSKARRSPCTKLRVSEWAISNLCSVATATTLSLVTGLLSFQNHTGVTPQARGSPSGDGSERAPLPSLPSRRVLPVSARFECSQRNLGT
jgi:hypothetical protein